MGTPNADFWNWLAKQGLMDNSVLPKPPQPAAPFSMSQDQVESSGGLAGLARARGVKPQEGGGGFGVLGGGGQEHPDRFDKAGNKWVWDPATQNYKRQQK